MKNDILRRFVKICCFVLIFGLMFVLIMAFDFTSSGLSSISKYRMPLYIPIASFVVPYFFCFSKWANKKIWKRHLNNT